MINGGDTRYAEDAVGVGVHEFHQFAVVRRRAIVDGITPGRPVGCHGQVHTGSVHFLYKVFHTAGIYCSGKIGTSALEVAFA